MYINHLCVVPCKPYLMLRNLATCIQGAAFAETGQFHPGSWDPVVGQVLVQKFIDITSNSYQTHVRPHQVFVRPMTHLDDDSK